MTDTNRSPDRIVPVGPCSSPLEPPVGDIDSALDERSAPLSVWYPPIGDSAGHRDLIRRVVISYSTRGQVVLDLDRDAEVAAVVLAAGRAYATWTGDSTDPRPEGGAHLALARWPRSDPASGASASAQELASRMRSHLRVAGHAVVVFEPSVRGTLDAGLAAPLIAAAARAGLGYRQNVVYLCGGISGDRLAEAQSRPPVCGWSPDWQCQAHRFLLVLFVRAGRRG